MQTDNVGVPQEPALGDDVVRDLYVCVIHKFQCDLYVPMSSDPVMSRMTRMLGRLEPMCQGEQVHELIANVEEHTEREEIYKKQRHRLTWCLSNLLLLLLDSILTEKQKEMWNPTLTVSPSSFPVCSCC